MRLRESIRRIGQTFASNLDRQALLELALKTALDAVEASPAGSHQDRTGMSRCPSRHAWAGCQAVEDQVLEAEREALTNGGLGEAGTDEWTVVAVAIVALEAGERTHGVITVSKRDRPFNDDDRDLLRSLASRPPWRSRTSSFITRCSAKP